MSLLSLFAAALLQAAAPTPEAMNGAWSVDLSTDPAQPYVKAMHLTLAADGTVSGDFYDSTIEAGRWKAQNGRVCVSFRTTDGRPGRGPDLGGAAVVRLRLERDTGRADSLTGRSATSRRVAAAVRRPDMRGGLTVRIPL